MIETCEACGQARTVVATVQRREAQSKTTAVVHARREALFAAVPVGRAHALGLKQLAAQMGLPETSVREYLRSLTSGRRVKTALEIRHGRGPGQRTRAVYWRVTAGEAVETVAADETPGEEWTDDDEA